MKFPGISSPALKKKSPQTSRGSSEATQRHTQWITSAGFFDSISSPGYYIVDLSRSWDSWYARRTSNQRRKNSALQRFRKEEVLGGVGGVQRGGFITWHEPRFCFTIPATIARKKNLRIGNPKRKFHHLPTHSNFAGVLAVAFTDDFVFLVCNSTVPLSVRKKQSRSWVDNHLIEPEILQIKPSTVPRLSSHQSWQPARPWNAQADCQVLRCPQHLRQDKVQ